jgi:hypothetical protein
MRNSGRTKAVLLSVSGKFLQISAGGAYRMQEIHGCPNPPQDTAGRT